MSAAEKIPFELQAINAEEAAKLFGLAKFTFLHTIASQPTFPARVNARPATWVIGEVLEWRDNNRTKRRRRA
ncbi:hypothetical protein [Novilysobacter erysipheiresistens]|uniref:AlpA family phage regulatory protein n=1 Tax=Novilysobacter erysipheiresistens TaxID=1749332 RepID=A0ABU7YUV7_9GAMM